MLTELSTRRPDWSLIPLAQAELLEQEIAQPNLDKETLKGKQDEAASAYLRAIEQGQRSLAVIQPCHGFALRLGTFV